MWNIIMAVSHYDWYSESVSRFSFQAVVLASKENIYFKVRPCNFSHVRLKLLKVFHSFYDVGQLKNVF